MHGTYSDKADLEEKSTSLQVHEPGAAPIAIKLDETGLPLIPQPHTSENDPLNYPNVRSFLTDMHHRAESETKVVKVVNPISSLDSRFFGDA